MVKFLVLLLILPVFLASAEFTASISTTQVNLNESFSLNLTLKDTSPKASPTISPLNKHFTVHSEQHGTNTTILNGKVASSTIWRLSLTPKMEGSLEIPLITIETEEGLLSTQPIPLNVIKGSTKDSVGLNISTKIDNAAPYKNEPLIYTAFLTSKSPLHNIQIEKLQVENAIVELLNQPKLEEKIIGGVRLNVVELTYLITPLKVGPLTIPPLTIQGATPQKRANEDLDLFALMQGYGRLKPFTLMTEEIPLEVQPPVPEVSPWLPAQTLTLEEHLPTDQDLRVGEPFSREFLIQGHGLKASQLPRLEDLQSRGPTFKVYADKPEEEEKVSQGIIQSMRKERYTFIPQEAGTWVLPEISINWWDSVKKEKRVSTVPARAVQVLPALQIATSDPQQDLQQDNFSTPALERSQEAPISSSQPPFVLYGIIGVLAFFLAAALLWGFTLQRKIASLTEDSSQKPIKPLAAKPQKTIVHPAASVQKEKKEKLPDLNPT
jgi:hypothetical protein